MLLETHETDSALGRWTLTQWQPPAGHPLAWAVERIWHSEGRVAVKERAYPRGDLEIIVQLDEPYVGLVDGRRVTTPRIGIDPIRPTAIVIEAPACDVRVMGVRLRPAGAYALLRRPLCRLDAGENDLELGLGAPATELRECCGDAAAAPERVGRALAWLGARLHATPPPGTNERGIAWATARLRDSAGAVPIDALRDALGLSHARLIERFRAQVGVTPKRYARIARLQRALALLQAGPRSLSDLALDAGYYDQAHMTGDFRELAGVTPGALLQRARKSGEVTLAEEEG